MKKQGNVGKVRKAINDVVDEVSNFTWQERLELYARLWDLAEALVTKLALYCLLIVMVIGVFKGDFQSVYAWACVCIPLGINAWRSQPKQP
jgi:hypothetical protein